MQIIMIRIPNSLLHDKENRSPMMQLGCIMGDHQEVFKFIAFYSSLAKCLMVRTIWLV